MSEELFKKVYAVYIATPANTFYTATGGRLEYSRAPESWTDNFAVLQGVDIQPIDTFRKDLEEAFFQISLFSSTRTGCWSLMDKCKTLFHRSTITPTGFQPTILMREMQTPPLWNEDDNLWQATIEFRCRLLKT